ncbi:MAG: UTP--glucose-1-phosphate uridylyltransferase [Gammaproteobacteria bacterium]|nr:UTP--glucose-1-phosphate uridylyltransferase [Gammaproteobacteria bacterium]HXK56273.1 UTP--glucose-1-phosphate uridylyltransferase [Gammaproteobacteria bacterium]
MPKTTEPGRQYDRTILLLLFMLFLFASPFTTWWAIDQRVWFLPYILWLLVILIAAWLHFRFRNHDL